MMEDKDKQEATEESTPVEESSTEGAEEAVLATGGEENTAETQEDSTLEAQEDAENSDPEAEEAKPSKEASKETAGEAKKEGEAEGKPEPEDTTPKLSMKWFVIHTYSGHENKVKENILKMIQSSQIEAQFGQLVVPTEEVAEMKKGKKTVTTRKFFPSYILIEMHMTDESWHLVNSIPGVTSFVGAGMKPQPLSQPEVERILGRMDKEKQTIIPEIPFTLGEHIRIKDGPFSDFTGVIDEINPEKGKLKVLVSIFGRETPVELDFLQVESV
jgi:transcriptional antiterminator NusG